MYKGHQTTIACPEEGDQDGERSQGQDLRGAAEIAWLVQLGEEKAEGPSHCSPHLPQQGQWSQGVLISSLLTSDGTRGSY